MDMVATHGVRDHYGTTSLVRRIDEALHHAGLADGIIGWADLAPLDQFHVRGLGATRELAEALGIDAGASLLDVGCGLGGPARTRRRRRIPTDSAWHGRRSTPAA